MPRPRRAMGRPGTVVVPATWAADHAAVIDRTLPATVRIGLPGTPEWSDANHRDEQSLGAPVYDGPAEIMLVTDTAKAQVSADERVESRRYEVKLPAGAAAAITTEMVVEVDTDTDPQLVGKRLSIDAIERGSRRFSRVLIATLTR